MKTHFAHLPKSLQRCNLVSKVKLENNIYSVSQSYPGVSPVGSVAADNRSNHRPAIIWSDEGMRLMDCLPYRVPPNDIDAFATLPTTKRHFCSLYSPIVLQEKAEACP